MWLLGVERTPTGSLLPFTYGQGVVEDPLAWSPWETVVRRGFGGRDRSSKKPLPLQFCQVVLEIFVAIT